MLFDVGVCCVFLLCELYDFVFDCLCGYYVECGFDS